MLFRMKRSSNEFDYIGQIPVTPFLETDVNMSFLQYEETKLEKIKKKQPAAVLRPNFKEVPAVPTKWLCYEQFLVTPKNQKVTMMEDGRGTVDEASKEGQGTLGDFLSRHSKRGKEMTEAEMFEIKFDKEVPYVNDIELTEKDVERGDYWTMFKHLGLEKLEADISGVTSPWGYGGTRGSLFPIHLEDSNLASINYHLGGSSKVWYVVDPCYKDDMVKMLTKMYPYEFSQCACYHRHKNLFINPLTVQKEYGIPVYKIIQKPGDVVVTWPGTFHWGFNAGANTSMAANYLPRGEDAKMEVLGSEQCSPECENPTIAMHVQKLFKKSVFKCKDCPKEYTTNKGLEFHMGKVHNKKEKVEKVACPKCKKLVTKLHEHNLRMHALEVQVCNLCGVSVTKRETVHWKACRKCKYCERKGITRIFNRRDKAKALEHFLHV